MQVVVYSCMGTRCIHHMLINLMSFGGFYWRLIYDKVRPLGQATQPSALRFCCTISVTVPNYTAVFDFLLMVRLAFEAVRNMYLHLFFLNLDLSASNGLAR